MKKLSVIITFLFSISMMEAQYLWDYGITLGGANYLGDIGGTDEPRKDFVYDMKLKETRYVFGAYLRRRISRSLNVKLGASYGKIGGDDLNTDYAPRRARNLNFTNTIKELSLLAEYTLYSDNDFGGKGLYNPNFRVYGMAGIAGFLHEPIGEYNGNNPAFAGQSTSLRELRTEGQETAYDVQGISVPMGFGFYFTYNRRIRLGWEMGYRMTFTDYLDDISGNYATDSELDGDPERIAYAMQTTPELIDEIWPGNPVMICNYDYDVMYSSDLHCGSSGSIERNPRGISKNNDGYLFMNITAGLVIQKKSRSFQAKKKKYSWLKRKTRGKRKSRAKF
ncbi:MAG: hypothetical protein HKN39_05430 [Flavobacteriales bacterium]|nr:hypothetical protein [Flavobacteriales bacterium]